MTEFLFKFSTTQTQQNGAINRMLAEIRQGFNGLYADFGGDLGDSIQAQLFATPISQPIDVGAYSASTRPDDQGIMQTTFVWGEFGPVADPNSPDPENPDFIQISTPGFWCDLLCDLNGTTVDPVWFVDTLNNRWNRGNSSKRQTTPEQQAVNGGKTEVDLVDTGSPDVFLNAPEFAKHGFAGVENRPDSGIPAETGGSGRGRPNG